MGKWYLGTFVFSTLLLVSPILALLFTPLFPVFIVAMVSPFVLRALALKKISGSTTDGAELKKVKRALTASIILGAIAGVPIWLGIVKILLGGRYL